MYVCMSRFKTRSKISKLFFFFFWKVFPQLAPLYVLSISKNRSYFLSLSLSIFENSGWGCEMCWFIIIIIFFFGGRIKSYFFVGQKEKKRKRLIFFKKRLPLVSKSLSPWWDGSGLLGSKLLARPLASSRWARRKRFETLGVIALSIEYIYIYIDIYLHSNFSTKSPSFFFSGTQRIIPPLSPSIHTIYLSLRASFIKNFNP